MGGAGREGRPGSDPPRAKSLLPPLTVLSPSPPPTAHEAGLVPLQVARDACLVSPSVVFEYRARSFLTLPGPQLDWLSLDGEWGMPPPPLRAGDPPGFSSSRTGGPRLTPVHFSDRSKSQ